MAFYNCILFDVEDTLIDFEAAEQTALEETLAFFSFPDVAQAIEKFRTIQAELLEARKRGEIKQDKIATQRFNKLLLACDMRGDVAKVNNYYMKQITQHAMPFPGAVELLSDLSEVATLVAVTNGAQALQNDALEQAGIAEYFDEVFASSRVGAAKPTRKIFDVALQTLGIENRSAVLVVGDSPREDILGGKNAGLDTCWYNRKQVDLPESAVNPTHTVSGFEELLRIVMEQEEIDNARNPEKRHQL